MSEHPREGFRPDIIVLLDASTGKVEPTVFGHRFGVVSGIAPDGTPIIKPEDEATFDHRAVIFHDLDEDRPDGLPDRRVSFQIVCDYDASKEPGAAPYDQAEFYDPRNRTTRIADRSGRQTHEATQSTIIDAEDGRYAWALALRSPLLSEDPGDGKPGPTLNGVSLPSPRRKW